MVTSVPSLVPTTRLPGADSSDLKDNGHYQTKGQGVHKICISTANFKYPMVAIRPISLVIQGFKRIN